MDRLGVRELKQNASAVLSQVEHGASFIVTVQGRDVGQLSPVAKNRWVPGDVAMTLYSVPSAPGFWADINESRQGSVQDDPWNRG